MKFVNRTQKIPQYIFSKLDAVKKQLEQKGIEIIDLGIGDPDIPTPEVIVNSMGNYIKNPKNYKYPPYSGIDEFKKAVANYYNKNYNVDLDYNAEVAALIGSKEGIAHLFLSLTDIDDYVILPDPAYPVYQAAAIIAGCNIFKMPLKEENNYLPDLSNIDKEILKKAKILIVNYPNNPTGAVADEEFYRNLIRLGIENDIAIVNDGAYLQIYKSDIKPKSLLEIPYAKNIAVEFGSLSKSYNMSGWRLGYVAGSSEIIKKLMIIKTNFDSGQFSAIQQTGAYALNYVSDFSEYINEIYKDRRKIVEDKLKEKNYYVYDSKGTFYVWFKVPNNLSSEEFSKLVLEKTGVLITPGNAFGDFGEGYCRISLTVNKNKLIEAMNRIVNM
ncbi:LL-diaminopimelate aminotransferase apoenzyme [Caloramator quimbayensis]|uniref:Aminotransferase n=1 Tax=Caloramator quimbayensis TaxID=1147123 RepID=A0A1T4XTT8_9CLOT|nr:aminotransferase class I/II-fold pyridoxal phosphate-dependent enzyme [Caloramator quimbayensis]SKA92471.1 LL-diaminopimelate aminotransferase apoenzyme [Caloramator quimbayensis]